MRFLQLLFVWYEWFFNSDFANNTIDVALKGCVMVGKQKIEKNGQ